MPFGYPASFKEQSHPGDHPPIIDRPLWDAVQARLAGNTAERDSGKHTRQPSLLAGMLFVGDGKPMTPSHTVKKGVRYRYYFSRPLITKDQTGTSTALRIPAAEIEQLVAARVRQWLLDPAHFYTGIPLPDLSARRRLVARAGEIGKSWPKLAATRNTPACFACRPDRADRRAANQIDIHLHPARFAALLAGSPCCRDVRFSGRARPRLEPRSRPAHRLVPQRCRDWCDPAGGLSRRC
jgi:hypothetical protein